MALRDELYPYRGRQIANSASSPYWLLPTSPQAAAVK